jgi:hypothetical protein
MDRTRPVQDDVAVAVAEVKVTSGSLYAAHFLGPKGAVALYNAQDDQPVVAVFGQKVVKANSFLEGKTIGWMKKWVDRKMRN